MPQRGSLPITPMLDWAHHDVVGSLLRPQELLRAQQDFNVGRISSVVFKAIEDRAVDEAVALQEEAGLQIVTDGEMRRLSFQSQMTQALEGFGEWDLNAFLWGDWHGDAEVGHLTLEKPQSLGAVGKLMRKRHLSTEEFVYLRSRTSRTPKITLPSPGLFANFWSGSVAAYPKLEDFLGELVEILRDEVSELSRLGATYIQIDAPQYPLMFDPTTRAYYESQGWATDRWLDLGIELDNAIMDGFPQVTFGIHL